MPRDHSFSVDYYNTKKLIKDLGLPIEKIDACKNGCILYWKDNIDLDYCKFYGQARYKPTRERNQPQEDPVCGVEVSADHPSPAERSPIVLDWVCALIGSHRMGSTYSCWPVILTPYNLPLGMCMSSEYMILTMVIPGHSNPKCLIDIYLEPLIEELQNLWHVGVLTRDSARDETFAMRTVLMWTVNDLAMNDTRIQQSIFNFPGRGRLNELYEHYDSEDLIIEELVATQFKD
ncbi:UNVERIFIED_CONTAM: hypothetical protein Slati_1930200 [Sesamum latifolium]|uniref:Uncharacterized protein n=1 Tax=Sesamum latifolium TaxID=2727402 RepID=A0AAW2X2I5_9LAMI